MDFQEFANVIRDPGAIVYLIVTGLMIAGMVIPFRWPWIWEWRNQFIFEGLVLLGSVVAAAWPHGDFGIFLGAVAYGATAFLLGLLSLFAWAIWRARN